MVSGAKAGRPQPGEFSLIVTADGEPPTSGLFTRLTPHQAGYAEILMNDLRKIARAKDLASDHELATNDRESGSRHVEDMTRKVGPLPVSKAEVAEDARRQQAADEALRLQEALLADREVEESIGSLSLEAEMLAAQKKAAKRARQKARRQQNSNTGGGAGDSGGGGGAGGSGTGAGAGGDPPGDGNGANGGDGGDGNDTPALDDGTTVESQVDKEVTEAESSQAVNTSLPLKSYLVGGLPPEGSGKVQGRFVGGLPPEVAVYKMDDVRTAIIEYCRVQDISAKDMLSLIIGDDSA